MQKIILIEFPYYEIKLVQTPIWPILFGLVLGGLVLIRLNGPRQIELVQLTSSVQSEALHNELFLLDECVKGICPTDPYLSFFSWFIAPDIISNQNLKNALLNPTSNRT